MKLTALALVMIVLSGCRETFARLVDAGVVMSASVCAREPMLAVGDSLQFVARVERRTRHSPSFNPLDGWVLYRSTSKPDAFQWSVRYPTPDPRAGIEGTGEGQITRTGMLIGRAPGYLFVYATSAGATDLAKFLVVPRVTRFRLTPRDTTIRLGDTVVVRTDAALETQWSPQYIVWNPLPGGREGVAVRPSYDAAIDTSSREQRFVASSPGTLAVEVCLAGTRRDTVILRVTQ